MNQQLFRQCVIGRGFCFWVEIARAVPHAHVL
eukprot:COSAG02_NODE_6909_length_3297_cov_3.780350_1_plen_31_part_10